MNEFEPPKSTIPSKILSRLQKKSTPAALYSARMSNSAFIRAQHLDELKRRASRVLINVYVIELKLNAERTALRVKLQIREAEADKRRIEMERNKEEKIERECARIDYTTARQRAEQLAYKQFLLHRIRHEECRADANRKRLLKCRIDGLQRLIRPGSSVTVREGDNQT